jgi:integrase
LPAKAKVRKVKHHNALAYAELPAFLAKLREQNGLAARALEFTILTAARTSETIGARRGEIDTKNKLWSVPAHRMKAGKDHRVPLSDRALTILNELGGTDGDRNNCVFPGRSLASSLSNMAMLKLLERMGHSDLTVHGFRSTFRDWAAECTSFPNEVVEMALAHAIDDKTEAAYRRGDLFEKRRLLMHAWGSYCAGAELTDNVVQLRNAGLNEMGEKRAADP